MNRADWDRLEGATSVPVVYVPGEPAISRLAVGEAEERDPTHSPLVGYGLSALIGVPAQASDATGHQRWTAGFAVASALLQLAVALVLVPRYGPIGAAIAVVINTVTQGLVFVLLVQYRFLNIGLLKVMAGALVRPLLAGLGLTVLVLLTRGFATSTPALLSTVSKTV